ncbi:MAG: hypothetical protein ACLPPF_21875 [Rhodomicrobium sp.]
MKTRIVRSGGIDLDPPGLAIAFEACFDAAWRTVIARRLLPLWRSSIAAVTVVLDFFATLAMTAILNENAMA